MITVIGVGDARILNVGDDQAPFAGDRVVRGSAVDHQRQGSGRDTDRTHRDDGAVTPDLGDLSLAQRDVVMTRVAGLFAPARSTLIRLKRESIECQGQAFNGVNSLSGSAVKHLRPRGKNSKQ